jgi:hypothetical protein
MYHCHHHTQNVGYCQFPYTSLSNHLIPMISTKKSMLYTCTNLILMFSVYLQPISIHWCAPLSPQHAKFSVCYCQFSSMVMLCPNRYICIYIHVYICFVYEYMHRLQISVICVIVNFPQRICYVSTGIYVDMFMYIFLCSYSFLYMNTCIDYVYSYIYIHKDGQ